MRIPEVQVQILLRGMGSLFPHVASSIFRLSLTRIVRLRRGPCRCPQIGLEVFRNARLCFTMELVDDFLKCLFRLPRGVPALVVLSEA